MTYEKKKAELQEIKSKESEARSELLALSNRRSSIGNEISQAYDKMIQLKADNGSEKDIQKAENRYKSLLDERDSLAEKIAVAERIAEKLQDEVRQAEREFNLSKMPYYQKELQPYFDDLKSALETAQKSIDSINAYQPMMQRDQVNKSALLRGISYNSQVVVKKENKGSIEMRNYITPSNL